MKPQRKKKKKKKLKRDKGITLIALVVTIIVLLILAGVAIATLTGNSSIIENSNKAAQAYNETASEEDVLLKELENKLKEYTGVNNDSKEDEKKDDEHEQKSDGSWDDTAKVNTPNLMEGMVAVYWSVDGGKT